MNALLEIMAGQGTLGQVVKHLVPWDGINKLIPVLNVVGGVAYAKSQGMDWVSAAVAGVAGMLATQNVKEKTKSGLGSIQFPGLGVRDRRIAIVKRSF